MSAKQSLVAGKTILQPKKKLKLVKLQAKIQERPSEAEDRPTRTNLFVISNNMSKTNRAKKSTFLLLSTVLEILSLE